jgi:hypothetical protein
VKLSEAIRLGAMDLPQGFGATSLQCRESRCALGAAAWAVGLEVAGDNNEMLYALGQRWQVLDTPVAYPLPELPTETSRGLCVMDVIWRLNDCEMWTREQIADWVATIEAQQEQPTEQPQPVSVEV